MTLSMKDYAALLGVSLIGVALAAQGWVMLAAAVVLVGYASLWALVDRSAKTDAPEQSVEPSELPIGFGRALLQQMPAPLIVIGAAGRLTYLNPAAEALVLGGATVGQPYSALIRAPAFVDMVADVLRNGEDRKITFTSLRERERHLEARASLLPEGGDFGEEKQVIVQLEDRTGDHLAMQTRTDFIANASHELRTPIASILGFIETLRGHARDDPEAREQFLGIMAKQGHRMQRLVEDLMSLSRIEMSAHVKPSESVAWDKLALEAASTLLPIAKKAGVDLDLAIDPAAPDLLVSGDRDQLAQVIVNLVDNAVKYGGDGGQVTVSIADRNPSYPGKVGISVTDDGPGIARSHLPRLTERFYRVNASQSRDKGGTGLGLAITKHILNRHEGEMDIRSAPGEGSRFTIWLPMRQNAGAESDAKLRAAE